MDPINYNIDVANPLQSTLQGFQGGLAMRQANFVQQQQEAALLRQQQLRADTQELLKAPTAENIGRLSLKYPEMTEPWSKSLGMMQPAQKDATLRTTSQVFSAAQAGRYDIAEQVLRDRAAALRNGGDEQQAKSTEAFADWAKTHPESFTVAAGTMLAAATGPEQFAQTFGKIGSESRDNAMAPIDRDAKQAGANKDNAEAAAIPVRAENDTTRANAEALKAESDSRNVSSQILERFERRGIDRDKLESELKIRLYELGQKSTALPESGIKIINEAAAASVAADQSSGRTLDLANRLEAAGGGYGGLSSASEWFKRATGSQDSMTAMRNEYSRIRNSEAMKSLPPGPASDKDIQMAMQGFPPESADAKQMASFLRGVAKMQAREAAFENARAEWVNAVGYLGKPRTDIEVDGRKVPAGTSFKDFAAQYLDGKVKEQLGAKTVQSRSYMRFASPAPAGGSAPGGLGSGTFGIPQGQ